MKNGTRITFTNAAALLGGAEYAEYNARNVMVKLPGYGLIRFKRSELPEPGKWTAFNLADACVLNPRANVSG